MKWRTMDDYYAVSECGMYTISISFCGDHKLYDAWHRPSGKKSSECFLRPIHLCSTPDKSAAIRACKEHRSGSTLKSGSQS